MDLIESIKAVQEAHDNNRLVIFVGSGVSQNSGIPTWRELIEKIAKKIKYRDSIENKYLLIPEYYYLKDKSRKHKKYFEFISDTLATDKGSNPIDDIIFSILPEHIITTNYDFLLENSTNPNISMYEVISQDSDLLSKANNRYIIKMHGSLDKPQTIVLKESDYIDYEQNHPLISTYIRSLLINHTFLFLGYSLNDYNLNLIIGWIEFFRKQHAVSSRPRNILIVDKEPSQFEKNRLENKNIFPINIMTLSDEVEGKSAIPDTLTSSIGRKIYSYLKCIYSPESTLSYISFESNVEEKYSILFEYNFISFQDLLSVQNIGSHILYANELFLYQNEWFERIKKLLENHNVFFIRLLNKSLINKIGYNNEVVEIPSEYEYTDKMYNLYLQNDYMGLFSEIDTTKNLRQKLFYSVIIGISSNHLLETVNEIENDLKPDTDYFNLILCKMSVRLVLLYLSGNYEDITREISHIFETMSPKYKSATTFLRNLFNPTGYEYQKMDDLLNKVKQRYEFNNRSISTGNSLENVYKLYSYAYNFYYFIFYNYYPLDPTIFTNSRSYLRYFIESIICTYSPCNKMSENDFFFQDQGEKYILTDFEIDLLTKFILPDDIKNLGVKYSINNLLIDESVNVEQKFINLCKSYSFFREKGFEHRISNQIHNLAYIIHYGISDLEIIKHIFVAIIDTYECIYTSSCIKNHVVWNALCLIITIIPENQFIEEKSRLIDIIFNGTSYKETIEHLPLSCYRTISRLSKFISKDTQNNLCNAIDSIIDNEQRIRIVSTLIDFLPIDIYKQLLVNQIDIINSNLLIDFISRKIIPYTDKVMQIMKKRIEEKSKHYPKGYREYPDQVQLLIDDCIILHLMEYADDLSVLKPYEKHSEHLQFILDPLHFDYTKVNLNDYRWVNLIRSRKYKHFLVEHKNEFLTDELRRAISANKVNDDQYKVLYGLLLNEDEIFSF